MSLHALSGGDSLSTLGKALADPLEGVQINQDVGQGVLVGDGSLVAKLGMEVFIHVEGIEGRIQSPKARLETQTLLHLREEWSEVTDIGLVKRLGQFGQNKLTPISDFCGTTPEP